MEINLDTIIETYGQITLFLVMTSIGLGEGFHNVLLLWRRRSLFIRSFIASFVLVPLAAMLINAVIPMGPNATIGMVVMAICPGAPMLYRKLVNMKANAALAGSYQVIMSLIAIVAVPLWILISNAIYEVQKSAPLVVVAQQILTVQIIPILLGATIAEWLPELGKDLFEQVSKVGNFLLLGLLIIVLIVSLPTLLEVGWGNVVSILLFVVAMVAIGHFLGGSEPQTRITMALANSSRNAGLALVLVTLNLDEAGTLVVNEVPVGETPIIGAISAIALLASVIGTIYVNVYQK